jgi:molecular chaperone DnaK
VSAKDNATGKEQKITIQTSSGLTEDEVERMRKDAEAHASEDKQRREVVDARNQAEQTAYAAEKMLKEHEGAEHKAEVERAVKATRSAAENQGNDAATIKKSIDELNAVMQKVGTALHQAGADAAGGDAGETAGAGAKSSRGSDDDDIKDADFEVK